MKQNSRGTRDRWIGLIGALLIFILGKVSEATALGLAGAILGFLVLLFPLEILLARRNAPRWLGNLTRMFIALVVGLGVLAFFMGSEILGSEPVIRITSFEAKQGVHLSCSSVREGYSECGVYVYGDVSHLESLDNGRVRGYLLWNFSAHPRKGFCVNEAPIPSDLLANNDEVWWINAVTPGDVTMAQGDQFHLVAFLSKDRIADARMGSCGIQDLKEDLGVRVVGKPYAVRELHARPFIEEARLEAPEETQLESSVE